VIAAANRDTIKGTPVSQVCLLGSDNDVVFLSQFPDFSHVDSPYGVWNQNIKPIYNSARASNMYLEHDSSILTKKAF
jgi:hypothetical protein